MVLAGLLFLAGCAARFIPGARSESKHWLIAGGLGIVAACCVLGLNYALTGTSEFHSVHLKGHFNQLPFIGAVLETCKDLMKIFLHVFVGTDPGSRSMYMLPLAGFGPLIGDILSEQTSGIGSDSRFALYSTDWTPISAPEGLFTLHGRDAVAGLEPIDRLDVGFAADELSHEYSTYSRRPLTRLQPFAIDRTVDGDRRVEVGRVLIGSETFSMRTRPGQAAKLILQTAPTAEAMTAGADGSISAIGYTLGDPLELILLADGAQVVRASYPLRILPGEFAEIVLEVNESFVNSERTTFTVGGDHISLGYRLYQ